MTMFSHHGFELSYADSGPEGAEPVLLVHGFASSYRVNWLSPGWVRTLTEAGYRVVGFDHRGHGDSSKSYRPEDYTPENMAGDAAALLDHLGIRSAHVMGYSMGARVAAFLALERPELVHTLILGGLGIGMITGVGNWEEVAEALKAEDPETIPDKRARMFRTFADQTKSDRRALAACIETSRTLLTAADVGRIAQPTLVAVGTKDDIAGSGKELAVLMPDAEAFDIEGRDHMLSVGDPTFKRAALAFLRAHPIADDDR